MAWSFVSLGEWLWEFEGGWHGLQRLLRLIHVTMLAGGMVVAAAVKVWHSL